MLRFVNYAFNSGAPANPFASSHVVTFLSHNGVAIMTQVFFEMVRKTEAFQVVQDDLSIIVIGSPGQLTGSNVIVMDTLDRCLAYLDLVHALDDWWFLGDNSAANELVQTGKITSVHLVYNHLPCNSVGRSIIQLYQPLFNYALLNEAFGFQLVSHAPSVWPNTEHLQHYIRFETEQARWINYLYNILADKSSSRNNQNDSGAANDNCEMDISSDSSEEEDDKNSTESSSESGAGTVDSVDSIDFATNALSSSDNALITDDIFNVSEWSVRNPIPLNCTPFFAGRTLVLTVDGYKEIQSIEVGTLVFTHLGNWRKITNKQTCSYDGEIVAISTIGNYASFQCTGEHLFLATDKKDKEVCSYPKWIPACELDEKKHVLCLPIEKKEEIYQLKIWVEGKQRKLIKSDWAVIGYHVGVGFYKRNAVLPVKTVLKEFASNTSTGRVLLNVFPEWIQRLPLDDLKAFIKGFEFSTKRTFGLIIQNEVIALHLQRLYAKLKRFVSISFIEDVVVLVHVTDDSVSFDNDYAYVPLKKIKKERKRSTLYNIEVENDFSFVAENLAITLSSK